MNNEYVIIFTMMNSRNEKFQMLFLSFPFLVSIPGALVAILLSRFGKYEGLIVILSFIGAILVLSSKIKLKRRTKKSVEWGMKGMSKTERINYIIGYILIVLSFVIAAVFILLDSNLPWKLLAFVAIGPILAFSSIVTLIKKKLKLVSGILAILLVGWCFAFYSLYESLKQMDMIDPNTVKTSIILDI